MARRCGTPIPDLDVLMQDIFEWENPNHIADVAAKKIASPERDGEPEYQDENQTPRGVKKITLPSWADALDSNQQNGPEVDHQIDQEAVDQIDQRVVEEIDQKVVDYIGEEIDLCYVNKPFSNNLKAMRPLMSLGLRKAFHFSPTSNPHKVTTAPAFSRALEVQTYRNAPMTARGPGLNRMCFGSRENYLCASQRLYGDLSRKRDVSGTFVEDPCEGFGRPSSSYTAPTDDDSVIKYRRLDADRTRIPAQRAVMPTPQALTINTDISNEHRQLDNWPLIPEAESALSAQSDKANWELPSIPADVVSESPGNDLRATETQQLPLIWQYYYATLHGSLEHIGILQRIIMNSYANPIANAIRNDISNFYRHRILILRDRMQAANAVGHGMRQTVAKAFNSAMSFAGTAAQRALALVKHRRPARVDTRGLTMEHLRRLKLNEWRKDRGNDVLEEFPFPDLRRAFDSPEVLANIQATGPRSVNNDGAEQQSDDGPQSVAVAAEPQSIDANAKQPADDGPQSVVVDVKQAAEDGSPSVDVASNDGASLDTIQDGGLQSCGEEYPLGKPMSAVSLFRPVPKPVPEGRSESLWTDQFKVMEAQLREKLQLGGEKAGERIRLEGPVVRPLSDEWNERVAKAMSFPANKVVATTLLGDPLRKDDLASCYTRLAWLNDEVINAYLEHIVDHLRRKNDNAGRNVKPRYHAFNSFFFSNLRDKGYASVERWATRAKIGGPDLLNVELVLIPVHSQAHWTMAVLKPTDRTIEHFDSLGPRSIRVIGKVKQWLQGELGSLYRDREWSIPSTMAQKQDNGSDCGVFSLITAKSVALGIDPISFGPRDIPLLRRKIVAELLNGGLFVDEDGNLL